MKTEFLIVASVILAGCASDSTDRSAMHMGQYGYTYDLATPLPAGSVNASVTAAPVIAPRSEVVFSFETNSEARIVGDVASGHALPITAGVSGTAVTNASLDSNLIVDRERNTAETRVTNPIVVPSTTVITEPAGASSIGDTNLSRTGTTVITNVPTESSAIIRSNNIAATYSNATVRAIAPGNIIVTEPAGAGNPGGSVGNPAIQPSQVSGAPAATPNFNPSTGVNNGPAPTPVFNSGGTDPNGAPAPAPNFNPSAGPATPSPNPPVNNGIAPSPAPQSSTPGFVPQGSVTPSTGVPAQPATGSRQAPPSLVTPPAPAPGQGNPGHPLPNPPPGSTPAQNGGSLIVPKR